MKNRTFSLFLLLMLNAAILMLFGCGGGGGGNNTSINPEPEIIKPTLEIPASQQKFTVEEQGGTFELSFSTNSSWTASTSAAWISVSPTQGTEGNRTLTVRITANDTQEDRTATVNIKAGTKTVSSTFVQKRKAETQPVEGEMTGNGNENYTPEEGTWD